MKIKKLITLLMLAVIMFTAMPFSESNIANGITLEEAQQNRNELQQQLIEINKKLAEIKDSVEKAQAKADTYESRKNIVLSQINVIKETIGLKEEELALKQQELDVKEAQQQETYELFKERARAMYMTNDTSALSAILGAETFSDFLVYAENMRRVSQHDNDLIDQLIKEQEEIKEARAVIEDELESLEADKASLDGKYSELAALYQEANGELNYVEALKTATQEDYDAILAEYNKANAELDALMNSSDSEPDYVGGYFAWPVPGFKYISSYYGWRPLYGQQNWHGGIDIAGGGIHGAPIIASNSGKVIASVYGSYGYGYYVMIDHGGNNYTVYGHMSAIAVSYGQEVAQGQTIGYVGSTGNSTGPHLHFEIRLNGQKVNPLDYVVR